MVSRDRGGGHLVRLASVKSDAKVLGDGGIVSVRLVVYRTE